MIYTYIYIYIDHSYELYILQMFCIGSLQKPPPSGHRHHFRWIRGRLARQGRHLRAPWWLETPAHEAHEAVVVRTEVADVDRFSV